MSELMKLDPEPAVEQWVTSQSAGFLFTTSISKAEVLAGITVMPTGRRRQTLESAGREIFEGVFQGRVLPFDEAASSAYADIVAARRSAGRSVGALDLLIAAIASSRDATVVTRDVGGFERTGVPLLNPWNFI